MALPYGLFSFTVDDVTPGGAVAVDLVLPDGADVDAYYKLDPVSNDFFRFDFDGQTGAVITGNVITLHLVDGGRGDADGLVNGTIVDPGGPGSGVVSLVTTPGGLADWTVGESGGVGSGKGSVVADSDCIEMREGNSFVVTLERELVIPADTSVLTFDYHGTFDTTDPRFINDAFEVALVDANLKSLVPTIRFGRDSFFNLTEEITAGTGVWTNLIDDSSDPSLGQIDVSGTVDLDVSELAEGTAAKVIFRLVNDDADVGTVFCLAAPRTPIAANDSYDVNEDTVLTVPGPEKPGVLENDSDPDGGTLTAALETGPAHGTLTLNPDGSFVYTPQANYVGGDTFTYRASDGDLDSAPATVTITVNPVNDPPLAVDDGYSVDEDTELIVAAAGILINDIDIDSPLLTAALVSGPAHGTLTLNANGSFNYVPHANFHGTDSFTYKANDGALDSLLAATVTIDVNSVLDAPDAANDNYETNEDTALTVPASGVLANDTDADGDLLSALLVAGPAHGTVTLNANGSLTYVPNANFHGSDEFTYRASDGIQSDVATVTIEVIAVPDRPIAINDEYKTDEDVALTIAAPGVLENDWDADGDVLTSVPVTNPANGTLTLNSNGSFTYTPSANFNGTDSFTYKANDGGLDSATAATVTIHVDGIPDRPTANDDGYSTNEDQSLTIAGPGVLGNDSDPDNETLSAILVTGPAHGTLALAADGSFTYTPAANYHGIDTYTYKASDGQLYSVPAATVTITVNPVPDAPIAADDEYNTLEDTPLTVAPAGVLVNDSDVDGDLLAAVLVSGPANGTLTLSANGAFTYTPNLNFFGADTFTYKANDGLLDSNPAATVTIHVDPVNDSPAVTVPAKSASENQLVNLTATFSDPEPGDTHTAVIDWGDGTTSVGVVAESGGSGTVTGSHTYADNGNYTMRVLVTDSGNPAQTGESSATAAIINVAPSLTSGFSFTSVGTGDNEELAVVVTGRFTDPGFTSALSGTQETWNVTIDWGDGTPVQTVAATIIQGSAGTASSGQFATTHQFAQAGLYTTTVTVTDDDGGSDSDVFSYGILDLIIDVVPTLDLKSQGRIPVKIDAGRNLGIDLSLIDSNTVQFGPAGARPTHWQVNGSGDVRSNFETQESGIRPTDTVAYLSGKLTNGTIFVGLDKIKIAPGSEKGPDGIVAPTPKPAGESKFFIADKEDQRIYRYSVSGAETGFIDLDRAIKDVRDVTIWDDSPGNFSDAFLWSLGGTHQIALQQTDGIPVGSWRAFDLNDPQGIATDGKDIWVVDKANLKVYRYIELARNRSFFGVGIPAQVFSLDPANTNPTGITTDGTYLWVSNDGADTPTVDAPDKVFVYTLGGALDGSWELDVNNDDPSGITRSLTDSSVMWTLDKADKKVYRYAGAKTWRSGQHDAQPNSGFTLIAANADPVGLADPYPYNAPPTALNDVAIASQVGVAVNVLALANDSDIDPQTLTITGVTTPTYGTATIAAGGTHIVYTRTAGQGIDTFQYTISDGDDGIATATVTILPLKANDDWLYSVSNWQASELFPRANDVVSSGPLPTIVSVTQPYSGTVTINSGGSSVTFTPDYGFYSDSFEYTVQDAYGNTATATVWLESSYNQPPQLVSEYEYGISTTVPTEVDVLRSAYDPEGEALTVIAVSTPTSGSAAISADGQRVIYTPGTGFSSASLQYTVRDTYGNTSVAMLTLENWDYSYTYDEPEYSEWFFEHTSDDSLSFDATALLLAQAIAAVPATVVGAGFEARPPIQRQAAIGSTSLGALDGNSPYAILSTGEVGLANDPGQLSSFSLEGASVRGNTDRDVTILRIDLDVPDGVNYLSLDFQFLTEEYPRFIDAAYNDAFIAELDNSTWTTSGGAISAPNNFAKFAGGQPVSVVGAGYSRLLPGSGRGTAYDGGTTASAGDATGAATDLLRAVSPITPGSHTLYLSIFDQGDNLQDSSVLLKALKFGTSTTTVTAGITNLLELDAWTVKNPFDAYSPVLITGEASTGGSLVSVTVNGTPVEAIDAAGHFFTTVTAQPGLNTFIVEAKDSLGNVKTDLVKFQAVARDQNDIDFAILSDASASILGQYGQTSFHERPDILYADLAIHNDGTYHLDAPLLVGVINISDPSVRVREIDGVTPDGIPYFNMSDLLDHGQPGDDRSLAPGETTEQTTISFYNPHRTPFTYDLVVLGRLNKPPRFTTPPVVTALSGKDYAYDSDAYDENQDAPLAYRRLAGPTGLNVNSSTGLVSWSPGAGDVGNHAVLVEVSDGRGGVDVQEYVISVNSTPNHPPLWTSTPITVAYVNTEYRYEGAARDEDQDQLRFSVVAGPTGLSIDQDTGVVTWTPTAADVNKKHAVQLKVEDLPALEFDIQTYEIFVLNEPGNHPPVIVSEPSTYFEVAGDRHPPTTNVTPPLLDLELASGQSSTQTVSITLSQAPQMADVFFALDDTESFEQQVLVLAEEIPLIISTLQQQFPNVDFGFGVGRFEDYNSPEFEEYAQGRPFILNQPIVRTATAGFMDSIESALERMTPGFGGDYQETLIEALYQIATGAGFDANLNGITTDGGPAGLVQTQINPGTSGDVPAFSTFTPDPANGVLAPSGTLGGVGFRIGAVPIIVAATDFPIAYEPDDPPVDPIVGYKPSITVPLASFQGGVPDPTWGVSRESTQNNLGARIQETADALNDLGAMVIGLGISPYPGVYARGALEALAVLTGAVNSSTETVPSGITAGTSFLGPYPDDPIAPGDPFYFYFKFESTGGLALSSMSQGVVEAVVSALTRTKYDVSLISSDPNVQVEVLTPPQENVLPGATVSFDVRITGDGYGHGFDLLFVRNGTNVVLGSLPVSIDNDWRYDVDAIDEDGDPITYSLLDPSPDGATINATTGKIDWVPVEAGVFPFKVQAADDRGGVDVQEYTVTVVMGQENSDPYIVSVAPTQGMVGRPYEYQVQANDDDGDSLTYLVEFTDPQNPIPGLNLDSQTGRISWTPAEAGSRSFFVRAFDNRGGQSDPQLVTINVAASIPNSPPEITSTAPNVVDIGESYVYASTAFDANGDPLTFSLPVKPKGMAIDPATGRIGWNPTPDQSRRSWDVVLKVQDPYGGFDIERFQVSVGPKNLLPQFTSSPPSGPAAVGYLLRYDADAFDQDGDTLVYSLDAASLLKNIGIDSATGVMTWTPGVAHLGPHTINITADDGFGGKAVQTFEIVVNEAASNLPPSIQTENLPSPAVVGKLYKTTILATDPDGDRLTFLLDEAPAGMSIDPVTGVLTWTPMPSQAYTGYDVIVSVRDARGARVPRAYALEAVASTINQAPQIHTPSQLPRAVAESTYEVQIDATDPDWDTLSYAVDSASAAKGITISPTGLLRWTPDSYADPSNTITVTVSDGQLSTPRNFSLTVDIGSSNGAPQFITTSVPTPALVGAAYQTRILAQDPDGDPFTYSLYYNDFPSPGPSLDPVTGVLTWVNPVPKEEGTPYEFYVDVIDNHESSNSSPPYILNVATGLVNHPPDIYSTPRSSIHAGQQYLYLIGASDPDGDPLTYSLADDIHGIPRPAGMSLIQFDGQYVIQWDTSNVAYGSYPVRLTVADGRGEYDVQSFTIDVQFNADNAAPRITSNPRSLIATLGYEYAYNVTATDDDGDVLQWSLVQKPDGMSIVPTTGQLRWTPDITQVDQQHEVVVQVADAFGGVAAQRFSLKAYATNLPPDIESTPPTRTQLGQIYHYAVRARDPEAGPLSFTISGTDDATPPNPISPQDLTINPATGFVTWNSPDEVGTYRIKIVATDERGASDEQQYNLVVSETVEDKPPYFVTLPDLPVIASVGDRYSFVVAARDDDGDQITYDLPIVPAYAGLPESAQMKIDPATGETTWTPTPEQMAASGGIHTLAIRASSGGSSVIVQTEIHVREKNRLPTIDSTAPRDVTLGKTYRYDVKASDLDGDRLKYALRIGPEGMEIDALRGIIAWQPAAEQAGAEYNVEIVVSDGRGGEAIETYKINVQRDTMVPKAELEIRPSPVLIGSDALVAVHATDDVGVTSIELKIGDQPVSVDADGVAIVQYAAAGDYLVEATVKDAAGNALTLTGVLLVRAPDPTAPQISLTSPDKDGVAGNDDDGAILTAPTPIIGSITDTNLVAWSVAVYRTTGDLVRTIASVSPGGIISSLSGATLGTFDPTLVENGPYLIRVEARDDAGNISWLDRLVHVDGALKLGALSLAFTDLEIPVSGLPLQFVRSYDSLKSGQSGDFGYGWSMSLTGTSLQVEYGDGPLVGDNGFPPFTDGTRVVITLPDGTKQGFTFAPTAGQGLAALGRQYTPRFLPDFGVTSELIVANTYLLKDNSTGTYLEGDRLYTPLSPYITGGGFFTLKLRSGVEMVLDAQTGDLLQLVDLAGNTLTFSPDGITHSAGRGIKLERDSFGRITKAIDPAGKAIQYRYSAAGDLVEVEDRGGNKTTFTYLASPAHYLDEIRDPLNRPAAKTVFYPDGRIKDITDAAGKTIHYDYDVDNRIQRITDQAGGVTEQHLDARGNIIKEIDPTGVITKRDFDGRDNLLFETLVIGLEDAPGGETNDLKTTYEYNDKNERIKTTDPRGLVTATTYNEFGQPTSTLDPLGNGTNNYFNPRTGTLDSATDASGNDTFFAYDTKGNLTGIRNDDNVQLVTSSYNTFGDITSTTPAAGRTTTFEYNLHGDRTSTSGVGFQPATNEFVRTTDFTTYDDNRRVTGTGRKIRTASTEAGLETAPEETLWTTLTEYNAAGQVIRQVDRTGRETLTTYDLRGQTIETKSREPLAAGSFGPWVISRTVYDAAGRTLFSVDSYIDGNSGPRTGTATEYDLAGRVRFSKQYTGSLVEIQGSGNLKEAVLTTPGTLVSTTSTEYDSSGRVWKTTDTFGRQTLTLFSTFGQTIETRTQSRDEAAADVWLVSRTVYDSFGRVSLSTDQFVLPGNTTLGSGVSPAVRASRSEYDDLGRVKRTERLEVVVDIQLGAPVIVAAGDPLSASESIFDEKGRVTASIAPDGRRTDYEFDSLGRQVAVLGHAVTATLVGLAQYAGKAVRLRTEIEYDEEGRKKLERTNIVQFTDGTPRDYSAAQTTSYAYDAQGNLSRTTFEGGSSVSYGYDHFGRRTGETDQLGLTKNLEYDAAGRLKAVVLPKVPDPQNGNVETHPRYEYSYDALGNQTTIRDALNRLTTFTFDHANRQRFRTLPDGLSEENRYNDLGQLTLHVDFEGRVTEYRYDNGSPGVFGTGRLLEMRFFDKLVDYNANPDAWAEKVVYQYDAFGRKKQETKHWKPDGITLVQSVTAYSYDAEGRQTEIVSPQGTVRHAYDNLGRLIATSTHGSAVFQAAVAPTEKVNETLYAYDTLGRMSAVTVLERNNVVLANSEQTRYEYDLLGRLDLQWESNGVVADYLYDNVNRLTRLTHFAPDATPGDLSDNPRLDQYDYVLRADGKRDAATERQWVDGVEQVTAIDWVYDQAGRLTSEDYDAPGTALDYKATYKFDLVGNRLNKTTDRGRDQSIDQSVAYNYDVNDRLLTEVASDVAAVGITTTYNWQQSGQWTTTQLGKTVRETATNKLVSTATYGYNLQGRMSSAVLDTYDATGTIVAKRDSSTFAYNDRSLRTSATLKVEVADGGGVLQLQSDTRTSFLLDEQNPTGYAQVLVETSTDAGGTVQEQKVFTVGLDMIAQATITAATALSGDLYTLHYDGHGSTRLLTNTVGAVTIVNAVRQAFAYDAYGNAHGFTPAQAGTNLLYSGEQFDLRLAMQYLRARYFNAVVGRFDRLDSYDGRANDPLSLNKYVYAHDNPVNGFDPSGLSFVSQMISTATLITCVSVIGGAVAGAYTHHVAGGSAFEGGVIGASTGLALRLGYLQGRVWDVIIAGLSDGLGALAAEYGVRLLVHVGDVWSGQEWDPLTIMTPGEAYIEFTRGFSNGAIAAAVYPSFAEKWLEDDDDLGSAILAGTIPAVKEFFTQMCVGLGADPPKQWNEIIGGTLKETLTTFAMNVALGYVLEKFGNSDKAQKLTNLLTRKEITEKILMASISGLASTTLAFETKAPSEIFRILYEYVETAT